MVQTQRVSRPTVGAQPIPMTLSTLPAAGYRHHLQNTAGKWKKTSRTAGLSRTHVDENSSACLVDIEFSHTLSLYWVWMSTGFARAYHSCQSNFWGYDTASLTLTVFRRALRGHQVDMLMPEHEEVLNYAHPIFTSYGKRLASSQ